MFHTVAYRGHFIHIAHDSGRAGARVTVQFMGASDKSFHLYPRKTFAGAQRLITRLIQVA